MILMLTAMVMRTNLLLRKPQLSPLSAAAWGPLAHRDRETLLVFMKANSPPCGHTGKSIWRVVRLHRCYEI